eukprot:6686377-Lingulodinium_polyedra.AAC.1
MPMVREVVDAGGQPGGRQLSQGPEADTPLAALLANAEGQGQPPPPRLPPATDGANSAPAL